MPPSRAMHPASKPALCVERYAVYDEFAAGGMATVHFARLNGAHGFRRTVAVKRLLPHLTRDQDFALMLIDEARLASRVRHHNVVSTLDVVQTADELLLVMEYVHGESLAKLARWSAERHEPIPVAIAAAIMVDALHGLHAAHEAKDEQGAALGLVHRDVSPQNVLVGVDGITRIADFGVAKAAGRAHSTQDGAVKGKLAYMAPEQLSGGEVSRVSDVFAAAVVLWEVLAGERLFAGSNHAETVFKLMSAPIPAPSTRRAALLPALDAIVLRGLERDPALRYASAREMALALESAAPSVRPSEIACWVEHVVGDRLSQRAHTLSAIERDEESDTQAQTALRERPTPPDPAHALASTLRSRAEEPRASSLRSPAEEPRASSLRSPAEEPRASTPQPPEGETGTHRKEPGSPRSPREREPSLQQGSEGLEASLQSVHEELEPILQDGSEQLAASLQNGSEQLEANPQNGRAPRAARESATRSALIAGSLVALLALLSVVAWTFLQRRPPAASTPPANHTPKRAEEAAIDPGHTIGAPMAAPVLALPAPALPAPALPAPAPALDAAASTRDQTKAGAAAPNEKRRLRPAHKSGTRACDPPYSIDPAGRVLFKVECM